MFTRLKSLFRISDPLKDWGKFDLDYTQAQRNYYFGENDMRATIEDTTNGFVLWLGSQKLGTYSRRRDARRGALRRGLSVVA